MRAALAQVNPLVGDLAGNVGRCLAAAAAAGEVRLAAAERMLRSDDVFHEPRWFRPGPALPPLEIAGVQVGVVVGSDLGEAGPDGCPAAELREAGAMLLACLAAIPFQWGGTAQRLGLARRQGGPVLFANLCGGCDELIFDGRSFALDSHSRLTEQLAGFQEALGLVDLERDRPEIPAQGSQPEAELFQALAARVRDFLGKNRLERAFLGLSGGIVSAVAAVIAAEALGPDFTRTRLECSARWAT